VTGFTNERELGIVTFVQDMVTKQIMGTAYTPYPTGSPRAVKILKVMNTPDRICTSHFTADLMVRNTGSETLTSGTLCVSINGHTQRTPWTGSMEPLQIATLRIPDFTDFTLTDNGQNEVELWLADLNGHAEDESFHQQLTIANAYQARNAVRLTIMPDQQPEEITWSVINSAGDVVCQGGPYQEARKRVVVDLPLTADDCYLLEFKDSGGDGIEAGRGYYMLHEVDASGKAHLMVQQTYSDALHDVFFSLQNASADAVDAATIQQQPDAPAYDLNGRRAVNGSHIIIYKDKKVKQQNRPNMKRLYTLLLLALTVTMTASAQWNTNATPVCIYPAPDARSW
jgi:hypothetical protein